MDVISLLTTVFGLAGAAGGVAGWFASSRGKTIIELLTKENEELTKSNARLEKERDVARTERDSLVKRNEDLMGMAQGSPQLKKLSAAIDRYHTAVERALKEKKR